MYYKIYNYFFIPVSSVLIKILRLFVRKLNEREKYWKSTLSNINQNNKGFSNTIWFHASSMGEFEQAKPVIELLKAEQPGIKIVCSFFSPSGYNNQRNYNLADAVVYLPFDTRKNVNLFLDLVRPTLAVFIRYDIWFNYLSELNRRKIPAFLICATKPSAVIFRRISFFSDFIGKAYSNFSLIASIGQRHTEYFKSLKPVLNVVTLTDTRFDRIMEKVRQSDNEYSFLKKIIGSDKIILVAGSTWQPDEELLAKAAGSISADLSLTLVLIIVPHEPTPEHINKSKLIFPGSILLSEIEELNNPDIFLEQKFIIVDSIGKLLKLYSLANIAYIGGGFGTGIHSVTEPAGYGIPVLTGKSINKSPDALELEKIGALKKFKNSQFLSEFVTELMVNPELRESMGNKAYNYIKSSTGSSKIISRLILDELERGNVTSTNDK